MDYIEFKNPFLQVILIQKKELTTNYPAIVLFDEGKAVRILQAKKDKKLDIDDVKHFIELNDEGE